MLLLVVGIAASPLEPVPPRSTESQRWVQDVFAIVSGGCSPWERWVAPAAGQDPSNMSAVVEARVAEFAHANFSVMLGTFGSTLAHPPGSPLGPFGDWGTRVLKQVELAEAHGIKIVPELPPNASTWSRTHSLAAARIINSSAFMGFDLRDEPSTTDFPELANLTAQIGHTFPAKLRFVNLMPNYAAASVQLKALNYTDYVDMYVERMTSGLDILCFDHYPYFEEALTGVNDQSSPAGYRANLGVVRAASLRAGVPFWNYFNVLPFGDHSDPTAAQLSWQMFTSLAYGAKGVIYFCYWSPAGGAPFGKGGGVIFPRGGRTAFQEGPHYQDARRISSILKIYGNFLPTATSVGIFRVQPNGTHDNGDTGTCLAGERDCPDGEQPNSDLTSCPMNATDVAVNVQWPGSGLLIGQFRLADGRTALLLHNQNWEFSLWPTVHFSAANMQEVDPSSGAEASVLDDSPYLPGLQLSFGAGAARLFVAGADDA
jgi:hypothetical protein